MDTETTFITGGSSGIGRALALELARRGRAVGLMARREDELRSASAEIEKAGGRVAWAVADVVDAKAMRAAFERLEAALGSPDCVVANAGYGVMSKPERVTADAVAKMFDVNVIGAVRLVELALPGMLARGRGHLVAVSSLAGIRAMPRAAAYGATKAALTHFFESLRIDLKPRGIDVTVVTPGFVKTPLTATNNFKMPFLVEVDDAGRTIARGIAARRRTVAFPWPLATLARVGATLPAPLYERIVARKSLPTPRS
ncbi:MAG: SDR family NAD(P)-dependent oxidoreductase [Deltaproteobacteria bacterium]|nr:SDR family NAD(P)-dependent oxidoreductase [Deltaproteobacteria bacterium]